jgi:hypothetical protein
LSPAPSAGALTALLLCGGTALLLLLPRGPSGLSSSGADLADGDCSGSSKV